MSNLPSSYYLRGSIPITSQVFIVTTDPFGILYYLTVIPDNGGATVVFDPRGSSGSLFSFQTSGSGVVFNTTFNGTEYSLSSKGNTIQCADDSVIALSTASLSTIHSITEVVTVEVSNYATLLTGVEYTVFNFNGNPIAFPMYQLDPQGGVDNNDRPIDILDPDVTSFNYDTTVRFLPVPIYPAGSCSVPKTNTQDIKDTEADWVYGTGSSVPKGYANEIACMDGKFFDYCGYGLICSSNCKGTCDSQAVCTYMNKDNIFVCDVQKSTAIEQSKTLLEQPLV